LNNNFYDIQGKTAVVTGGGGVLCTGMCHALARAGAQVAVLDLREEAAATVAQGITKEGGKAIAVACNVLDKGELTAGAQKVEEAFGGVDFLINGAGGNRKEATTTPDLPFFDLPSEAIRGVFDLNFLGVFLPSQVFGSQMAKQGEGVILNISSMNAFRPLTRIPAYSAAKAAVSNFTQWLAVYLAQEISPGLRVNALAPGFFLTEQNRYLLTTQSGELTERGKKIIEHTPMRRFGSPEDLIGTMFWLLSPASAFVTGVVVPIDGGFSAFSGV
jgi:NAD(P)-dependent dehydrogenase (short-subunit alcohol dehydrogenase family)